MSEAPIVAGVELGGTKVFVLRARGREIVERVMIATGAPDETLRRAAALLQRWQAEEPFEALGIASFGPLRVERRAVDFGRMLATPKPGWTGADIYGVLAGALPCPAAIDTDVNGAALAEARWGAGLESETGGDGLCYLTIGTGLGGGFIVDGRPLHGAMHPELGHILVRRAPGDDFAGACPFHGDCIEGLVSGPALARRFGAAGDAIAADDPRWHHVVHDIAQLVGTILLTTAARKVLIGGGVSMGRPGLIDRVRERVLEQLNGYLPFVTADSIASIVRLPALGELAGPLGAVALALDALDERPQMGRD